MKVTTTAVLDGKEIANQIVEDVKKNHGIVVNDSGYIVKCLVFSEKAGKEIEIPLDKVRFVFER